MTTVAEHDALEARIGALMGVINTATAQLVSAIAEVLRDESWSVSGIRSAEHWVGWQCGVSAARASELVRMARRVDELPECAELFAEGQLTEDCFASIARHAPGERDGEVAALAPALLHSQLRRWLRALPPPDVRPVDEVADRPGVIDFGRNDDRWWLRANLPLDQGALVEQVLTAARSQLFWERHPDAQAETRSDVTWTDALVHAADAALLGLDRNGDHHPGHRHQVVVHHDTTAASTRLHQGPVLPDCLARYLTCDADVRAIVFQDGVLQELARKTRTVDDRLRSFIEHRDGGCRVPGCRQRRWLHIHHVTHWEAGGPTSHANLCALCPRHHREHHLGQLNIEGDPTTPTGLRFTDRHGRPLGARPPSPPDERPPPPPVHYQHPTGERIDKHWMTWNERARPRSEDRVATVDDEVVAGVEGDRRVGQVGRDGAELIRIGPAAHRRSRGGVANELLVRLPTGEQIGVGPAGADRVHPYAVPSEADRHASREAEQRGLRGRVVRLVRRTVDRRRR